MKKIVESFDFEKFKGSNETGNSAFKVKKLSKNSILDIDNENDSTEHVEELKTDEIVIPQSLQQTFSKNEVNKTLSLKAKAELKKKNMLRVDSVTNNIQQKIEEIQQQRIQLQVEDIQLTPREELAEELTIQYQEETNNVLPVSIDIVEVAEEIQTAAEEIPDANTLSIGDFDIVEVPEKGGWTKGKVTIKSEVASDELSEIATIVKKTTNNEVLHRAMDFRTIGNTNKTQLKTSNHKLYSCSYIFKPKAGGQIVAQKYARIILSIPNDYNTTKRVLLFIQESRGKFITEINMDIQFIAKLISDYYIVGFDATLALLKSNSGKNPLNVFINKLMISRKFSVKVLYNNEEQSTFDHIVLKSKTGKHQWLKVHVKQLPITGTYGIYAKSSVDSDWKGAKINHTNGPQIPITLDYLMQDETLEKLDNLFTKVDWSVHGMGEDDVENRQYYLMSKISYRALKTAFIEIYDLSVETPESGLFIKEVLSQLDTAKDINSGYKAETIIGKSNFIDYFILSWLAVPIKGGNTRTNKDESRNYDARPFMFQITYSISGKTYSKIAKTFDEIKESTGFLTTNPIKL